MISLSSIFKASQALASELALETLLVEIMRIVIENAAAQTGYLILRSQQDEKWRIEASGTIASDEVQVLQSIPIETVTGSSETPLLSPAIANYVIRTQTSVVLHDAVREGEFTRDPYIIQQQPKSILCMPLSVQDKLVGILYLENNLTTGVFTPDRLDALNLLFSQAAISIENAKLYAQLRGGEISVSSQVGRGTTFTFDIRVQLIETPELEHQQPTRRAIALEPNQPSYRILIVDDTVNNRQVLSELLSPFGFELQ
jgi:GAF domain-containing protein